MKQSKLLNFLLFFALVSCGTQEPAPIQYGSGISSDLNSKSYDSSDKILSKKFSSDAEEHSSEEENKNENHTLRSKDSYKQNKKYTEEEENEDKLGIQTKPEQHQKDNDEDLETELNAIEKKEQEKQGTEKKDSIEEIEHEAENREDKIVANDLFILPVKGKIISQFGDLVNGSKISGINIETKSGERILASASGKVIHTGKDNRYGNIVILSHENNLQTAYAYLDSISVEKGDLIKAGEIIGVAGKNEENISMLHFAIREGKIAVDPLKYINSNN